MRGVVPASRFATLVLQFALVLALLVPALGASHGHAQVATPAAESAPAGWTNFKGDASRRGVADAGPTGQPVRLWRVQADGPCNPPPAVVAGVVYAPCGDGVLYVLDAATGAERWRFTGAGPLGDVTVVGGLIYVNDTDVLHALDAATGQERWHAAVPGGTGVVVDGGLLVLGTGDGFLLGLDAATGTERWRFPVTTQGGAHNAALGGGVAYVGGDGVGLVAVDAATGALLWRGDTGTDQTGTAVVSDGIAYIGAPDVGGGHLYAFDATSGALLWRDDKPLFTPAVLDGVGYSGSVAGIVSAFDTATGKERWRVQLGGVVRPVAVARGVVYAPSDGDRALYALDAATGKQLSSFAVDGGIDGSVAVDGGAAYVTTVFGGIYAIGGTDQGAIGSPVATSPAVTPTTLPTKAATEAASPAAATGPAVEVLWQAPGGADGLAFPAAMALDPQGRLWVADTGHDRFQIFDADGTFVEAWGGPGRGDGEFSLARSNGDGYGAVAFAPDGSFYVLDVGNFRVQKFDEDRRFVLSWGGFGRTPGTFTDPIGLAVDAAGTVYVLDDVRDVVERFGPDGAVQGAFDAHPGSDPGFNSANGLAVDAAGNVYVSNLAPIGVEKFDPAGILVATIGEAGTDAGQFGDQPWFMAIDAAGRLFVGVTAEGHRIAVFDADGRYLTEWGGAGQGDGEITFPSGLVLDGQGNAYVADAEAGRVVKFRLLPPLAPT